MWLDAMELCATVRGAFVLLDFREGIADFKRTDIKE